LLFSKRRLSQKSKNTLRTFLKIFSRTSRPISVKLGINHFWVKGILNCSNKGPDPLQRGDDRKNAIMGCRCRLIGLLVILYTLFSKEVNS
jgi:hypothetical protein